MLGYPGCRTSVRFGGPLLGREDAEGNHATASLANAIALVTVARFVF